MDLLILNVYLLSSESDNSEEKKNISSLAVVVLCLCMTEIVSKIILRIGMGMFDKNLFVLLQ